MRAPPNMQSPAPLAGGDGAQRNDRLAGAISPSNNRSSVSGQVACQYCGHALPKRKRGGSGRGRRFCGARCQKAAVREKATFEGAGYNPSRCPKIGSKSPISSTCWHAQNGHPYPSQFSVPLDLLGRGYRWPEAPQLDRETRDNIAWREIGRAP
jgi:hypothetical protein